MLIVNPEVIDEKKLFHCKSKNLKRFFVEIKGLRYISKSFDIDNKLMTWTFIKSEDLLNALVEWQQNKIQNTLAYPK